MAVKGPALWVLQFPRLYNTQAGRNAIGLWLGPKRMAQALRTGYLPQSLELTL